jgi:hypothetical protein
MLKKLGEHDLAWIAADRSILAAERAEDPLLVAASAYRLANVFASAGRTEEAEDVAMSAAAAIRSREDGVRVMAVWGGLVLTAVLAAARRDDRRAARRYLRLATPVGDQLGWDVGDLYTIFGPTVTAAYEVKAEVEFGNGRHVLGKAEAIEAARLPAELVEQRASHLIDLARCHAQRPDDAAAVAVLERAERLAPEEVRYHALVRELLRDLLRRERRSATPGLRGLASRVGVLN